MPCVTVRTDTRPATSPAVTHGSWRSYAWVRRTLARARTPPLTRKRQPSAGQPAAIVNSAETRRKRVTVEETERHRGEGIPPSDVHGEVLRLQVLVAALRLTPCLVESVLSQRSSPAQGVVWPSVTVVARYQSWYHGLLRGVPAIAEKCLKPASQAGFRIVGATGFEPATFRPPAERATKLRHAPWPTAV